MATLATISADAAITSALSLAPVALLAAEQDGRVTDVNPAWTQLTGLDHSTSANWGWLRLLDPDDRTSLREALGGARPQSTLVLGDYRLRTAERPRWSRWTARRFSDEPLIVIAVVDVDADRSRVETLRRAATSDSLTGLANRAEFLRLTTDALKRDSRTIGVCYVDLDAFKAVNDTAGHLLGDQVLVAVAARLAAAVRPGDLVARVGGDEFAVLLTDNAKPSRVVERLSQALTDPIRVADVEWRIGATIGLATARSEQTAEELLDAADKAMYAAKMATRKQVVDQSTEAHRAHGLSTDLANKIVYEMFSIGLSLAATIETVDGPAADRLADAIGSLDQLIVWVRDALFETDTPDLSRLHDLTSLTAAHGRSSIHLLNADHSIHRALIELSAELGPFHESPLALRQDRSSGPQGSS